MGLLKNIQWTDNSNNILVYKIDMKNDYISKGSVLTVRESQAAIFCDKGRMADVFLPGYYKLDTNSLPIITKLLSWKYGFENPFRSDIYFVNTKQFTNQKWGTINPIIVRDKDYGAIRIRGYGVYSFRIADPFVFMQELSGTNSSFKTSDIVDYLKSIVVTGITDAIGENKIPVLDMAANLMELGKIVQDSLQEDFNSIGLELTKFNFENFSLPEELEKALDKSTSLGMMKNNMDTYMQMAQADALKEAAKNPGMAGSAMGAGIGLGMGAGLGNVFGNMYNQPQQTAKKSAANTIQCSACQTSMDANAKFCPSCGAPAKAQCPKCKAFVKQGSKFCPECGVSLSSQCPKCNHNLKPGSKFCPECGEKV